MIYPSKDSLELSKKLIEFAKSEILKKDGPFPVSHKKIATYLGVSRSMVQAVLCGNRTFARVVFERVAEGLHLELGNFIEILGKRKQQVSVVSGEQNQLETLSALTGIFLQMRSLMQEADKILGLVDTSSKKKR